MATAVVSTQPGEAGELGWLIDAVFSAGPHSSMLTAWSAEQLAQALVDHFPGARLMSADQATLSLMRAGGLTVLLDDWPPVGWLPWRWADDADDGQWQLEWIYVGIDQLRRNHAFYDDGCRRAHLFAVNRLIRFRTPMSALIAGGGRHATVPLHGLVFHMSRCGSTWAGQLLGAPAGHLLVAEADPIDGLLRRAAHEHWPPDRIARPMRALAAAFGHGCARMAGRLFIKLDAWHTPHLPLLRAAFPEVAWVYLFRDPVEVMASHMRQPGRHCVPGTSAQMPGSEEPRGACFSREDYTAHQLAQIGQAVISHWRLGGGLALDYRTLVRRGPMDIFEHFGICLSKEDWQAIDRVRTLDAKSPTRAFVDDGDSKRMEASSKLLTSVEAHLASLHNELRALEKEGQRQ